MLGRQKQSSGASGPRLCWESGSGETRLTQLLPLYRSRAAEGNTSCQTLSSFNLRTWSDKLSIRSKVLNQRDSRKNCWHQLLVTGRTGRARWVRDRDGCCAHPLIKRPARSCLRKASEGDSKKGSWPCSLFPPLFLILPF